MPAIKDTQLGKDLKAGTIAPIYFLYGEEVYLLRNLVKKIVEQVLTPGLEQFNFQQFEQETISFNQLQTAYEALPMMAEYKCVTVKNWKIDKLSKKDFDSLLELLKSPNPSTVLVFYYTEPLTDVKKNAKYKKLCAQIERQGVLCEVARKDRATLRRAINNHCKKAGVTIQPDVCNLLIEHGQSQYAVILNELEKLVQYVGEGGVITRKELDQLGIVSVQDTAFDLSNAILQGRYANAFEILDRLFYLRMEPVMIMGALNFSFIDLYRVKAASLAGKDSAAVIKEFRYRSKYRVQKLSKDVGRFSMKQIRNCLLSLERADLLLKSSRMEGRIVMEQMIGEMISFSVNC